MLANYSFMRNQNFDRISTTRALESVSRQVHEQRKTLAFLCRLRLSTLNQGQNSTTRPWWLEVRMGGPLAVHGVILDDI